MKFKLSNTKSIDFVLLIIVVLLSIISLVALFSIRHVIYEMMFTRELFKKQFVYVVVGFICMLVCTKIEYNTYKNFSLILYFATLILLMLLFTNLGSWVDGARRWLLIGPLALSPTILAEITMIVYLSSYISRINGKANLYDILMMYIVFLIPTFLILLQPNFIGAAMCLFTGAFIVFIAGHRILPFLFIITSFLSTLLYMILSVPYRVRRIMAFMNPEVDPMGIGYQIIQSFIALSRGGFTGVGFNKGIMKHAVPNIHTDFILCSLGEEFGFLGIGIIIILFLFFIHRGFLIALRSQDTSGKLIASGITFLIAIKSMLHMGVVSGLFPTCGVALPFVSYGGPTVVLNLFLAGILLNISCSTGKYYSSIFKKIRDVLSRIFENIRLISVKVESHPLYKIFAFIALLLTFVISITQLYHWFK